MSKKKAVLVGAVTAWLLMSIGSAAARANVDKTKLRDAASVHIDFSASIGFTPGSGYFLSTDENPDPPKPESILKTLRGDASDAERYGQLANIMAGSNAGKAEEYWLQAANRYAQQIQAEPKNAILKIQRAIALYYGGRGAEGETLARLVAEDSPKTWQAWTALGEFANQRAWQALLANVKPNTALSFSGAAGLSDFLQRVKPTPEQLSQAAAQIREAQADFDKAVAVAPESGEVYATRAFQRWTEAFSEIFRKAANTRMSPTPEQIESATRQSVASLFAPDSVSDFVKASQLHPNDPLAQGMGAFILLMSRAVQSGSPDMDDPNGLWAKLSKPEQATIRRLVSRLQTLENGANPTQAAQAAKVRGIVTLFAEGRGKAVSPLRHAVTLAPDDVQSASLLSTALMAAKRFGEVVPLLETQLKTKDTLRRRLLLARAYDELDKPDKAREQLQAALRLVPDDYQANLAFTAHLLRNADTGIGLEQAGQQLTRTANVYPPTADTAQSGDYHLLRGIYLGLTDHFAEARKELTDLRETDKDNKAAAEALTALGE